MDAFLSDLAHHFTFPVTNPVLIFAILLLIILLAPVLLKKMHAPGIIGLIVAGIIIGEFGLNIIANNEAMRMFSTIGLMYIMFTAGLELDFNEFKINQQKSLMFGGLTFIFPLLIGYPVCHYLLGYSSVASFLTASMFSTHTLVSYPIVSRMGVSKNQAVAITVGGTIFTDAAVLIILAIITTSGNEGGLSTVFWIKLIVSLLIFSMIVFLLIPKLAKWFFQKVEDDKYSHYVLVLFILFLCGFLAQLGGLEPIIGAFAGGLALNKLIPHSSVLMNRIDFFGNSLFIPIFLISVGMVVNLRVVFNGWNTIYIAAVLSAVAIVGKYVAAFFTQKAFRYSNAQRNIIFGLSSAHAAATLAVIIIGYQTGILDEYILNGTIILILVTCVVSSFTTQKASRQIAVQESRETFTPSSLGHFAQEKILLPIANPLSIGYLVDFASLIKDNESENSISLLGVMPNNVEAEKNIIQFRKELEDHVNTAAAAEQKVDIITTIDHNVPNGIVRTARETMSDIVIMGWPGKTGLIERFFGDIVNVTTKRMDKNLFICRIEQALMKNNRIVVFSPPMAEREYGFALWIRKIIKLAQELSVPILHVGHPDTQDLLSAQKSTKNMFTFQPFTEWTLPLQCSNFIKPEDLVVVVSAHPGSISYMSALDAVPMRMEEQFPNHNRIIIYPQQRTPEHMLAKEHSIFIPIKR